MQAVSDSDVSVNFLKGGNYDREQAICAVENDE